MGCLATRTQPTRPTLTAGSCDAQNWRGIQFISSYSNSETSTMVRLDCRYNKIIGRRREAPSQPLHVTFTSTRVTQFQVQYSLQALPGFESWHKESVHFFVLRRHPLRPQRRISALLVRCIEESNRDVMPSTGWSKYMNIAWKLWVSTSRQYNWLVPTHRRGVCDKNGGSKLSETSGQTRYSTRLRQCWSVQVSKLLVSPCIIPPLKLPG